MKIIDLLNKIANGEEVPKEIEHNGDLYLWEKNNKTYYSEPNGADLMAYIDIPSELNDEVEIIEEEKEDNFSGIRYFANGNCYMSIASEPPKIQDITIEKEIEKLNKKHFHKRQRQLANKINELIDEINKLKNN